MNIVKSTARYEAWLAHHVTLIPADLGFKHRQMASAAFPFLRATYYRWAQTWPAICPEAARAPKALAVGDLHVENFGTWRDIEGRLVWGINDFDEVYPLPYTNDLVRLAASAFFAVPGNEKFVCETLLAGYRDALGVGGRPYVLAEHHASLREMASHRLREPEKFWEKLHSLPDLKEKLPAGALKALARMLPERGLECRFVHRLAGLGSLGRQRFVALADWHDGSIAREAKALAPSACLWAEKGKGTAPILYQKMLDSAVRCRDPFVAFRTRWIVRRLAPDCSRIELYSLPRERDEAELLHAMGFETANIHLGSLKPKVLLADLKKRPRGWLAKAAGAMQRAVIADWEDWKKHAAGAVVGDVGLAGKGADAGAHPARH